MPNYTPIKSFNVGDVVDQVFLIRELTTRLAKSNKTYSVLTLADQSGEIDAKIWDFDVNEYSEIAVNGFVNLKLEIQEYRGQKNAISRGIPMPVSTPADTSVYEISHGLDDRTIEGFYRFLLEYKDKVKSIYLKTYLDVIFANEETVKLLKSAPASTTNRGAYKGGLVEHVSKVMMNAMAIVDSQEFAATPASIDRDLVITGVLVHDLGKIFAYSIDAHGASTTSAGVLLQHLPMSYSMSVQAFIQAESILRRSIPEGLKDHVNHIILSHHGRLDYGSPVTPKSLEAQIVHMADMADSTISNFAECTVAGHPDKDGFVEGNRFSSKRLYVSGGDDEE